MQKLVQRIASLRRSAIFLLVILMTESVVAQPATWTDLSERDDRHWIAISAPQPQVIWLAGTAGTVALSIDAGTSWSYSQPGPATLEFRDIEALDAQRAYALSVGENGNSRIYYTANGGRSWTLGYRAPSAMFINCIALSKRGELWGYADSLNGRWELIRSADGRNWITASNVTNTPPLFGEGGFAASGQCVRHHDGRWAIGTGNAATARVLTKNDLGIRFQVQATPMPAGAMRGITTVWPMSDKRLLVAGGDLQNPQSEPALYLWQDNSWQALPAPPFTGPIYSLSVSASKLLVTGPNGAASTPIDKWQWTLESDANLWTSTCLTAASQCFVAGRNGLVARLDFSQP